MKRLFILLALALLVSAPGCRCGWFNRGPACNTAPMAAPAGCATSTYGAAPVYSGAPVYDPQPGL